MSVVYHLFRCLRLLSDRLLDLDNFKEYNDTYGHPAGDQLLRVLASALRDQIRGKDTVARYGGDEFAVILPGSDLPQGYDIANRICFHVAGQMADATMGLKVTISMGVASTPIYAQTPMALVQASDKALYQAKQDGGNRVVVYGADDSFNT